MRSNKKVTVNRYLYAAGRIKALEMQMLDANRINRLHEAQTVEEINRVLTESGYPVASDPETRLSREMVAVYQLMQTLFPEPAYIEALVLFHDFHNLKVILKSLTQAWPHQNVADEPGESSMPDNLPEAAGPFSLVEASSLDPLFQYPALVEPHLLFAAVRDRQTGLVPEWLYAAAVQAAGHYLQSYDISDIDLFLDRLAFQAALDRAAGLGNAFFSQYLQLRADLANLGLLMRTRFLRSGQSYLEQALLPGGSLAVSHLLELYDGTPEQIKSAYANSPCSQLADLAGEYGQAGTAGRFSLLADNLIIAHIRPARQLWRGPEVLLAYLIGREMEIKNIRITLTCLRNGLSANQARDMNRDRYLTWR